MMKIAVTSADQTLDSEIDPRFGRAAYFLIIDTDTMNFESIDNNNVQAGGAGINAAKNIVQTNSKAVLTGNCGPNAQRTLSAANVKLYTGLSGMVKDAVEAFKAGKLTEAQGPNVEPNFGAGI